MAEIREWPWALNQAGYKYPAEFLRSQHYSATSGGNGVSSPASMKVLPQPAPDGTVQIVPGGADVVSTYDGQRLQTYYSHNFQTATVPVAPTGSASGGRTDLVIRRVLDPDHEPHPDHEGEMTAEAAELLDFQWFEVLQGQTKNAVLNYPHVKLAEIRRPANTTIVNAGHITDLREMSDPKTVRQKYDQMVGDRTEVVRTGTWRVLTEVSVEVPEWATHAAVDVSIGGAYMRGAFGRGAFGMTGLGNTSAIGHTPWWEADGDVTAFRRIPYIQAGRKLNVRQEYRGTVATIYIQARVDNSSDQGFIFGADYGARAFVDVDWLQDVE